MTVEPETLQPNLQSPRTLIRNTEICTNVMNLTFTRFPSRH